MAGLVTGLALRTIRSEASRPSRAQRSADVRSRQLTPPVERSNSHGVPANPGAIRNVNAFIPPQCYAKTVDERGQVHNPCYVCHASARAPNYVDDIHLQREYAFEERARENAWQNAFEDFTARIAGLSEVRLQAHVRQSNYFDARGEIVLEALRSSVPETWDVDGDGRWSGFVPDARYNFDNAGFDRLRDGGYTGWRAYAYYPVPGAFLPTNGSLGDALIRLPEVFREDEEGRFDVGIYALNLAILEALVTRRDVPIDATEEAPLRVDLDRDGALGTAQRVAFAARGSGMQFVGRARLQRSASNVPGLYPEGTEFLHSLRYLDVTERGVVPAPRMKELRYARKVAFLEPSELRRRAHEEVQGEREFEAEIKLHAQPATAGLAAADSEEADESLEDELGPRAVSGNAELGVDNDRGFRLQGFIEDASGRLRPQSFEESVYCVGCHGGLSATDDGIFSFSRRLGAETFHGGWFHPQQRGLEGVPDPRRAHSTEYVRYLELNGAGDDYRENREVLRKFFGADGRLLPAARERLRRDVTELLLPSPERARLLNKSYYVVVQEQSFARGRELAGAADKQLHRSTAPGQRTGIARAEPAAQLRRPAPQNGTVVSVRRAAQL